jgi:hypothetical protein
MNGEGFVCDLTYCAVCLGAGWIPGGGPDAGPCDECDGSGLNPYMEPEHGKPTRPEEEALDYDGD